MLLSLAIATKISIPKFNRKNRMIPMIMKIMTLDMKARTMSMHRIPILSPIITILAQPSPTRMLLPQKAIPAAANSSRISLL